MAMLHMVLGNSHMTQKIHEHYSKADYRHLVKFDQIQEEGYVYCGYNQYNRLVRWRKLEVILGIIYDTVCFACASTRKTEGRIQVNVTHLLSQILMVLDQHNRGELENHGGELAFVCSLFFPWMEEKLGVSLARPWRRRCCVNGHRFEEQDFPEQPITTIQSFGVINDARWEDQGSTSLQERMRAIRSKLGATVASESFLSDATFWDQLRYQRPYGPGLTDRMLVCNADGCSYRGLFEVDDFTENDDVRGRSFKVMLLHLESIGAYMQGGNPSEDDMFNAITKLNHVWHQLERWNHQPVFMPASVRDHLPNPDMVRLSGIMMKKNWHFFYMKRWEHDGSWIQYDDGSQLEFGSMQEMIEHFSRENSNKPGVNPAASWAVPVFADFEYMHSRAEIESRRKQSEASAASLMGAPDRPALGEVVYKRNGVADEKTPIVRPETGFEAILSVMRMIAHLNAAPGDHKDMENYVRTFTDRKATILMQHHSLILTVKNGPEVDELIAFVKILLQDMRRVIGKGEMIPYEIHYKTTSGKNASTQIRYPQNGRISVPQITNYQGLTSDAECARYDVDNNVWNGDEVDWRTFLRKDYPIQEPVKEPAKIASVKGVAKSSAKSGAAVRAIKDAGTPAAEAAMKRANPPNKSKSGSPAPPKAAEPEKQMTEEEKRRREEDHQKVLALVEETRESRLAAYGARIRAYQEAVELALKDTKTFSVNQVQRIATREQGAVTSGKAREEGFGEIKRPIWIPKEEWDAKKDEFTRITEIARRRLIRDE
jgi:hypothetical protein